MATALHDVPSLTGGELAIETDHVESNPLPHNSVAEGLFKNSCAILDTERLLQNFMRRLSKAVAGDSRMTPKASESHRRGIVGEVLLAQLVLHAKEKRAVAGRMVTVSSCSAFHLDSRWRLVAHRNTIFGIQAERKFHASDPWKLAAEFDLATLTPQTLSLFDVTWLKKKQNGKRDAVFETMRGDYLSYRKRKGGPCDDMEKIHVQLRSNALHCEQKEGNIWVVRLPMRKAMQAVLERVGVGEI